MAFLITNEIARGGITGLLTRVMRAAASEHAAHRSLLSIAMSAVADLRDRNADGFYSGWAVAGYRDEVEHYGTWPMCRGGWPTVTIEDVTFFDAPHGSDGSIGTVLACYDTDDKQACALYGFRADGSISLWAN